MMRTDVGPHASPGVNSHNDTALEYESQRGGAMTGLHQLHHLALKGVHLSKKHIERHVYRTICSNWAHLQG